MNEHIEFQTQVIAQLSRLETHMETLVGNGHPGRISKIEDAIKATEEDIDSVRRYVWMGLGVIATISAVIHFVFKY
jgi:uncharacterized protein Yka (UPF0111/DUF47 family)